MLLCKIIDKHVYLTHIVHIAMYYCPIYMHDINFKSSYMYVVYYTA